MSLASNLRGTSVIFLKQELLFKFSSSLLGDSYLLFINSKECRGQSLADGVMTT